MIAPLKFWNCTDAFVWTKATHRVKTGWQGLSRSTTQRRAHPHGSLAFEKHW